MCLAQKQAPGSVPGVIKLSRLVATGSQMKTIMDTTAAENSNASDVGRLYSDAARTFDIRVSNGSGYGQRGGPNDLSK